MKTDARSDTGDGPLSSLKLERNLKARKGVMDGGKKQGRELMGRRARSELEGGEETLRNRGAVL